MFYKFLLIVNKKPIQVPNFAFLYRFKVLTWNIECLKMDTTVRQIPFLKGHGW